MDRGRWEQKLTYFQAYARGYMVRREVRRAQEDFEDIVREIDGGLAHLEWREMHIIPIPHFTDTQDGPFLPASSLARKPDPGAKRSAATTAPSLSEDNPVLLEKTGAERDCSSKTKGQDSLSEDFPLCGSDKGNNNGQTQMTVEDKGEAGVESTGDSTTIWSSLELDMDYSHVSKGARQYRSAQEVPRIPEALRLHRNTLTMELLWLQQAIGSRKKYLSLKDRLSVS